MQFICDTDRYVTIRGYLNKKCLQFFVFNYEEGGIWHVIDWKTFWGCFRSALLRIWTNTCEFGQSNFLIFRQGLWKDWERKCYLLIPRIEMQGKMHHLQQSLVHKSKVRKIDTISKKFWSTYPIVLQRILVVGRCTSHFFHRPNTTVIRLEVKVMAREEKFQCKWCFISSWRILFNFFNISTFWIFVMDSTFEYTSSRPLRIDI